MILPYGIAIEIEGDYSRSKSNKILPLIKCYLPYICVFFFFSLGESTFGGVAFWASETRLVFIVSVKNWKWIFCLHLLVVLLVCFAHWWFCFFFSYYFSWRIFHFILLKVIIFLGFFICFIFLICSFVSFYLVC